MLKHYAIEGDALTVKGKWMQQLLKGNSEIEELHGKKGVLFSNVTLERMIEEEFLHDDFSLSGNNQRSIRTFSSGEQKKALLNYLINQSPDFIVLDNPFDCLDIQSVAELKNSLNHISENIPIIQVFKRHNDVMPFITDVLVLEKEDVIQFHTKAEFEKLHLHRETAFLTADIPAPIKAFENIPEELIAFKGVSVSYEGRSIVSNIHWSIKKGEFWQLIGPNGSGKTTMLSMIYGDNPKAFGEPIFIFGYKKGTGESVWDLKEKMGYFTPSMTERFHSSQTVEQMVISGLVDSVGLYLKPSDRQKHLANEWLKVLGLEPNKSERFYRQSQVNQRMIMIARAMIKHPPLLILDEPSTGLDDFSASLMVQLIQKIAKESSTAILYVSHRKEEGLKPNHYFELIKNVDGGYIMKV